MKLKLIGINHRTSSIEVRDRAAMSDERISSCLIEFKKAGNLDGAVILSTCNRSEIYLSPQNHISDSDMRQMLSTATKLLADEVASSYVYKDEKAVEHLFKVASGLDSQLVGESQILKQVRDAYYTALDHNSTNRLLNKVFLKAIECGKDVRYRTAISEGAVSVASAAVQLAERVFGSLKQRNVLIIGAGETGKLAAKYFKSAGVCRWRISNRTLVNGEKLAAAFNGDVAEFPPTESDIRWADLILSATSSTETVIGFATIKSAVHRQPGIKLFLDLAVPRDIDPQIKNLSNIYIYSVDDFKDLVKTNLDMRQGEIARAAKVVDKHVAEFTKWYRENRVAPTIKQLQDVLENIRQSELNSNIHRFKPEDHEQLDKFSRSLMRKVTSLMIANLKRASNEDDNISLARAVTIALSAEDEKTVNEVLEKLEHEFSS